MDSKQIIHELKSTLNQLEKVEKQYCECKKEKQQIQFEIEQTQHLLIIQGKIDGKNQDIRKAQKWVHTKDLQEEKRLIEIKERQLEVQQKHLERKLSTLQTIANIIINDKNQSNQIMLTLK
mgnify:CR=1 FL=1